MSKEVSSIPFENPFDIPEGAVADFASAKFSEDFIENTTTTFIYLRNIEYKGTLVFDGLSYEQKETVLRCYMLRDIRELAIKELDDVLFKIFLGNMFEGETNFFTDNEIEKFISNNSGILNELHTFLRSVPLYVMSLDKSNTVDFDPESFKRDQNMPKTYECAQQMIKNIFCDLLLFQPPEFSRFDCTPVFFDAVFKYDNGMLADLVQGSTFAMMYSRIVDKIKETDAVAS